MLLIYFITKADSDPGSPFKLILRYAYLGYLNKYHLKTLKKEIESICICSQINILVLFMHAIVFTYPLHKIPVLNM